MNNVEIIDKYICKYQRLAELAYEREWFKEQEQYLCVVQALDELRREIV